MHNFLTMNYIPSPGKIRTITDMRERAVELIREAREKGPLYIFRHNKPQAVILDMEEYQKYLDLIDEYYLALKAKEFEEKDRQKEEWVTLSKLQEQLNIRPAR